MVVMCGIARDEVKASEVKTRFLRAHALVVGLPRCELTISKIVPLSNVRCIERS
jgi:hypothetical protein